MANPRRSTKRPGSATQPARLALLAVLLAFPLLTSNSYYLRLLTTMGLYVVLAMGLNVLVGLSGLLDMGYVGFFAVGAYARALLASPQLGIHLPFLTTWAAAVGAAVLLALAIGMPTLRLRGDYLAIVTMGFAEIVRILLTNLDRPRNITNGPNGIIQIDPIRIGPVTFDTPTANYYLIFAFAAVAYAAYLMLARSSTGLRWRALKDDTIAAESFGVDVAFYRVLAFAVGAVFAATAGVLFASWQSAVFPQNFTLNELITLYCMVVLGGAGNPAGSLLGIGLLVAVPELLRGYSVYRMLIYGVILVAFMIFRPQGLLPVRTGAFRPRRARNTRGNGSSLSTLGTSAHPFSRGLPSSEPIPVLSVQHVSRRFGGLQALDDVSLDLFRGEILSIIGPNGAGKTTLVNIISGVTRPTSGQCLLEGRSVIGLRAHSIYRLGLSRTFQNLRLFGSMTVAENLVVGAAGSTDGANSLHALDSLGGLGLASKQDLLAGGLSYAHRKGLEIIRALAGDPRVVLLDEPAAGMSPDEAARLMDSIRALKSEGRSVVLIEHQMPLVMAVSDRIVVLDRGKKIAEGTPAEVAADPGVAEVYLGTRASTARPPAQPKLSPSGKTTNEPTSSGGVPVSAPLLELVEVDAAYGPVKALHGISLTVNEGEIVCLLGSNGAGKTTTLRTIIGGLIPSQGKILFQGRDISGAGPSRAVAGGISIVPEGRRVFAGMTVEENLLMGATRRSGSAARAAAGHPERAVLAHIHASGGAGLDRVYATFPRLGERKRQKASTLSGGEQQMLAIGRALMAEPRLLLLDEPSMGLAPIIADRIFETMANLGREGTTILLVEQNARRALEIGHRAYVLQNGAVVAEGTPEELLESQALHDAYLAGNRGA